MSRGGEWFHLLAYWRSANVNNELPAETAMYWRPFTE